MIQAREFMKDSMLEKDIQRFDSNPLDRGHTNALGARVHDSVADDDIAKP